MGCQSTPPITEGYPHQQALQGKSKEQVLSCAGTPLRRNEQDGELTLLHYYREAPLLEESMVSSKSSRPTVHHGCWATVVHPSTNESTRCSIASCRVRSDASNDCEEIFASCAE